MIGITWAFTVPAVLAVFFRFYVRIKLAIGLAWDDWIMLIALVSFHSFLFVAPVGNAVLYWPSFKRGALKRGWFDEQRLIVPPRRFSISFPRPL